MERELMGDPTTGKILIVDTSVTHLPGDLLDHVTCTNCWPNFATEPHLAMCGAPLRAQLDDLGLVGDQRCTTCVELVPLPCPVCGLY